MHDKEGIVFELDQKACIKYKNKLSFHKSETVVKSTYRNTGV